MNFAQKERERSFYRNIVSAKCVGNVDGVLLVEDVLSNVLTDKQFSVHSSRVD